MSHRYLLFAVSVCASLLFWFSIDAAEQNNSHVVETGPAEKLILPPPNSTRAVANPSTVVPWPKGQTPKAPAGFEVTLFADDLDNPRMIYVLPNSDVLVMESMPQQSQSRIVLLRDSAKRGRPDLRQTFLRRLNMAFGMTLIGNRFYVGNTDGIVVLPYATGETRLQRRPEKILDLPSGGHYTRNLLADPAGKKIYVAVGSATNVDEQRVDEKDPRRAAILQVNPDGSGMRVFASGMRNPVGMDWEVKTNRLWTVVNERDMLGDELVPDYLTSVRDGAFYGWPYSYFGQNEDPRKKAQRPDLVAKAIKPDYALGSHVAPLGLAFYNGKTFPEHYHGGAFIGMHGSWNRSNLVGYKVAFVPFENGRPSGAIEDFLTGFIVNPKSREVYGRPVGVALWTDGSLLVADDAAGKIWRISARN
ncbi:MAG TPA: sorbosone dehydrogenase family protein [Candidatus Binatia bacterium]|jgi:glucose/arabinose dehydrogenase|nr:sorbosone dehydrogenase family protein [Candidatus Binatia bacterium]